MISQMLGVGIAHAKIILVGEHAVVYNQPAIAIPLTNLTVTTTIRPTFSGQTIESSTFHGDLDELGANVEGLRQLILKLLQSLNLVDAPFTLEIETNIPQERGFGASAAFATSITKAFFDYVKAPLSPEQLKHFTDLAEGISHGSASGLDAATVGSDDPIWFVKNETLTAFKMTLTGTLVVADTGIHGQTMHAVNIVKSNLDDDYDLTWQKIVHLGQNAEKVRTDLTHNHPEHVGLLFTAAHHELQSLGVSHPKLDNLVNAALHAGALGAKLTGAGIGGAMFALAKNNDDAITIANALTKAGAQNTWIQPL